MTINTIELAVENCIEQLQAKITNEDDKRVINHVKDSIIRGCSKFNLNGFISNYDIDNSDLTIRVTMLYKDDKTKLVSISYDSFNSLNDKANWRPRTTAYASVELEVVDFVKINHFNIRVARGILDSMLLTALAKLEGHQDKIDSMYDIGTSIINDGLRTYRKDSYNKELRLFGFQDTKLSFQIDLDGGHNMIIKLDDTANIVVEAGINARTVNSTPNK